MSFPGSIPSTNPQNLALPSPVGIVSAQRDPGVSDNAYAPGLTEWINTLTGHVFKLTATGIAGATWDPFAGPTAGDISTITGDSGGAISGDSSGNINLLGAAGQIVVTGNSATNTLTLSLAGGSVAIDSFQPDTGTDPVVPTAAGLVKILGQSTPSTSGIRITGATNEVDIAMYSPFEGDFSFTQSNTSSNTNRKLLVSNLDTANSGSNAQLAASVGGTSSGDAHAMFSIASTRAWSIGSDTSASGSLKITTTNAATVTPSSGTTILESDTTGLINIPNILTVQTGSRTVPGGSDSIPLSINQDLVGGTLAIEIFNTDNSNVGSRANLNIRVGGTSAGDPVISWIVNGSGDPVWCAGTDNSDSDKFKISANISLGIDDVVVLTNTGDVSLGMNNTNTLSLNNASVSTIGANGAADALTANPVGYISVNINGTPYQIPYYNHA